jgi:hypothetical protein
VGSAFCSVFLKVYVSNRVDDQDFAVLSDSALLCTDGTAGDLGFDRSADTLSLGLLSKSRVAVLRSTIASTLLLVALHGALLLPVPLHALFAVVRSLRAGSRAIGLATGTETRDVRNAALLTPCRASGVLDEALDVLAVVLVVHVEGDVVHEAAEEEEQTDHDRTETRTETLVVVASASPLGEAIVQEVIVAFPLSTAKDADDQAETLEAGRGLLGELVDLALGGLLVLGYVGGGLRTRLGVRWLGRIVGGDPVAAGLVGVQRARQLAVGFRDLIVAGTRLHAGEVVEGDIGSLGLLDFVSQAENLVVFLGPSGGDGCQTGEQQGCPDEEVHGGRMLTLLGAGQELPAVLAVVIPGGSESAGACRGTLEHETSGAFAMFRCNKTAKAPRA